MDAVIGTGPGPVSAPAGLQISGAGFRGLFRFRDSASAASAATERSKPMPKEKADWGPESPGKRLEAHTGDTQRGFLHRAGQDQSGGAV